MDPQCPRNVTPLYSPLLSAHASRLRFPASPAVIRGALALGIALCGGWHWKQHSAAVTLARFKHIIRQIKPFLDASSPRRGGDGCDEYEAILENGGGIDAFAADAGDIARLRRLFRAAVRAGRSAAPGGRGADRQPWSRLCVGARVSTLGRTRLHLGPWRVDAAAAPASEVGSGPLGPRPSPRLVLR